MSGTLLRAAAAVALLTVALALPVVTPGAVDPKKTPTTESCTAFGCQPTQDPADTALAPVTVPQRENVGQAGYALWGFLVVLLVSIPIVVTWQRNVRQKAAASVGQPADVVTRLTRS